MTNNYPEWVTPAVLADADQERAADAVARPQADKVHRQFQRGLITLAECIQELTEIWSETR